MKDSQNRNFSYSSPMRFLPNSPIIPSHLLEQQAHGNVIFFCGAGISVPSGLDTFWQLTDRIIANLDSKKARAALTANESFDRIFNLLVREFGREEIDREIFGALETREPTTLKNHKAILNLSRGAGGSYQIVTTNFDKLFEQTGAKVRAIVPPGLPDIELNQPIKGVVYLHGRLADPGGDEAPRYVISSSDFGRAYLAEGWATRFVKALREKYTLVLLGYSADDPPMRYLLEGLNVRDGVTYESPIYVFTDKTAEDAEELWQDRGVTPICYAADQDHSALWSTISAWAKAARSPEKWNNSIIDLARRTPSALEPYQRGQVVQLVSTKGGAKFFADAQPAPSAEWLCVFDPYVRFAEPRRRAWQEDATEVDPQSLYGLDDDPARPPNDARKAFPDGALNPLSWQKGDGFQPERISLQGWSPLWHSPLPERLHHLARWFGARAHEPAAIWWAAGSRRLNPHMHWFIENRVRSRHGDKMPATAQMIWSYYLETSEASTENDRGDRWFEFEGMLKRSGWTPAVSRFFERCATPLVELSRPSLSEPRPPAGEWGDLRIRDVVDLKVRALDRHGHKIDIPPEASRDLLSILRRSLIRFSDLLEEIEDYFWRAPTLYPELGAGEQYHGKKAQLFLWFKKLFSELIEKDAEGARKELSLWPANERRVFPKLKLWSYADTRIADAREVAAALLAFDAEALWDAHNQREFLHLLRARWPEFSKRQRRSIELVIEAGPPKWPDEKRADFRRRRSASAASNLRWLELNGCQLTTFAARALQQLKAVDPRWTDNWAISADESFESRGGVVEEVIDVGDLHRFSPAEIIERALERTVDPFSELKHYRPFRGLIEQYPFKALAALRIALRRGDFPVRFWNDLLWKWPAGTSLRLRKLLARTVASLPADQALELRYYSTSWLEKHLASLYTSSRSEALAIFDAFLTPFENAFPESTSSSLGTTSVGGVVQVRSEVSIDKAINSPIGNLTEALWSLTRKKARRVRKLNGNLASRFARLVAVPGHGGGHAAAILARHLSWIEYCYEDWMRSFLLPMFEIDHPLSEAVWHGFAGHPQLTAPTWRQLKEPMLSILKGEASWRLDLHEYEGFAQSLVPLSRPSESGDPLFSFSEIKETVSSLDDAARGRILWRLAWSLEEHGQWEEFVKPFIQDAWPRHLRFRSDETTRGFVHIAEKAGSNFPDAVRTVLPLIRAVPNADLFTYRISRDRDDRDNIARDYPKEALQLLNAITADDKTQMPYDLGGALEALAELDPSVAEMPEYRRLKGLLE